MDMNMRNTITRSLCCIIVFATLSYAGSKRISPVEAPVKPIPEDISAWYAGIGVVATKFHACGDGCSYEDLTYGAMLRGGYDVNQYFGIEGRVLRTFLDKGPFGGLPLQHLGLYLKPQYPVSERINVYGLLGYGYTQNLGYGARLNYFDHDDGFSAGLGIEYDLSDKEGDFEENANYDRAFDGYADQGKAWSLFLDYQRLLIKSNSPEMDALSFGFRYDF